MASKEAIGRIEHGAMLRLEKFGGLIAESLNLTPVVLPSDRDPAYQRAVQLDALATWFESVADALGLVEVETIKELEAESIPTEQSPFAGMSAEQLAIETAVRGLEKPIGLTDVLEWSAWLEEQDAIRAQSEAAEESEPKDNGDSSEKLSPSKVKRLNLPDLIEYARKQGIEPKPDDTRSDIIAAIEQAEGEGL